MNNNENIIGTDENLDEQDVAKSFDEVENSLQILVDDDAISEAVAKVELEKIKEGRRFWRDLSKDERKKLVTRRTRQGLNMAQSSRKGDIAHVEHVVIQYGLLKNRFLQYVPFVDRAITNLTSFGEMHFGKQNAKERLDALVKMINDLHKSTKEKLDAAIALKNAEIEKFDAVGENYLQPCVPTPSVDMDMHIHSKISFQYVEIFRMLDQICLIGEWFVWNELRTKKESNSFSSEIMKELTAIGSRAFSTNTSMYVNSLKDKDDAATVDDMAD